MASKKNTYKKTAKKVAKQAKKNPKTFLIILLVAAILIGAGVAVYFIFIKDKNVSSSSSTSTSEISSNSNTSYENAEYNPKLANTASGISINFLELGNWYTGDSTYIKAGDVDILIDAGSRNNSAKPIKEFIDQYCTDGTLEYVIVTHAHQDHIAGFVGTNDIPGIFNSYKIGTLIDFALSNTTSNIYKNYVSKRDAAVASGDIQHHYTAAECVTETNGASKEYTINEATKMTILDQRYYHENSSDENNYSVCALFSHVDNHYLFTGDLEKEGEASLVELNTLPKCQLFKGGHHGSKTSNTDTLLSVIQPEVVCVCCCCGNNEYTSANENQFPTQIAINNIAKYTERIYVTTISTNNDDKTFTSMNGNINFKSEDGKSYIVAGSNNSIILKETDWFKNNRTWPS